MASFNYESTPETTNANRACRCVLGPCTDGLRDVLRHHVNPIDVSREMKKVMKKHNPPRLTPDQRDLILPKTGSYSGNYSDMDISLLYLLLRNVSGIPPHTNGWGNDPDPSDRSLSANIERIRLVRNRCVHCPVPYLSNNDFVTIWGDIRAVMVDVDNFLHNANHYQTAVDQLKHETMDPEKEALYEQELRKQVEEDKTTREMVVNLESKSLLSTICVHSLVPYNLHKSSSSDLLPHINSCRG
jgi:hypothetical protein